MADKKLSRCNEYPIVLHPSSGSGDCIGVDGSPLKAGQQADWVLPPEAFQADNLPQDFWQDEETELFVTTESEELIELV